MKRVFGVLVLAAAAAASFAQADYFHRPSPFAGKTLLTFALFDEVRKDMQAPPELISREDGLLVSLQQEFDAVLQKARSKNDFSTLSSNIDALNYKYDKECVKLFTPEQLKRLKQLFIQYNGGNAITNPILARDLNVTDEEKEKIKVLQEENREKVKAAYVHTKAPKEVMKKLAMLQEQLKTNLEFVLDEDQHKRYLAMQGDKIPFKKIE